MVVMEDRKELEVHEGSEEATHNELALEESGKLNEIANPKLSHDGIILIPQPSDDPDDPLVSFLFNNCYTSVLIVAIN